MNLPNRITLTRIFMIPVFVILMLWEFGKTYQFGNVTMPLSQLLATAIFVGAATTDWVDGHFARKYNLVTNFGKFLDPLADKMLVISAFIVLTEMNLVPSWIVIIIVAREFAVTGLRLILADSGEVVAANMLGKIKTWTQIIAVIALLLENVPFNFLNIPFANVALYVATFFTIWSGVDYFVKNKHAFRHSK